MSIYLEIGSPILNNSPKNKFKIEVSLMHGDGDHYNTVEFQCENKEEVIELIDLFDRMIKEYPNGRGGNDNYYHIDGFEELTKSEWPWDITSDYNTHADITDYNVFYYNESRIKHEVIIRRD